MAPQGNPLAYIRDAIMPPGTGTDPNSDPEGAVLRDRFHQIRGSGHADQLAEGHIDRLAAELVQSRGAPMTPQNVQMAREYLLGGGMGRFEQAQSTEDAIADEAIAAEGGGGMPSGAPPTGAPPMARPGAAPSVQPEAVPPDDTGGLPILPVVPPARRTTDTPTPHVPAPGDADTPPTGGREVMVNAIDNNGNEGIVPRVLAERNGWRIVGVNVPQDPALTAPPGLPQLPYDPNVPANPEGSGGRISADVIDAEVVPDVETRPIPTEDVVPDTQQGREVGTGSVPTPDGPYDYTIYRDDTTGQFYTVAPDGQRVEGGTPSIVRRTIRHMF